MKIEIIEFLCPACKSPDFWPMTGKSRARWERDGVTICPCGARVDVAEERIEYYELDGGPAEPAPVWQWEQAGLPF